MAWQKVATDGIYHVQMNGPRSIRVKSIVNGSILATCNLDEKGQGEWDTPERIPESVLTHANKLIVRSFVRSTM